MNENCLSFDDLFGEVKLEIFKYLTLNERIKCRYVSREWSTILSSLAILQRVLAIGQPEFDSTDRMKLSLCNINSRHIPTPFNTIDLSELMSNDPSGAEVADGQKIVSQLLMSFKNLRSVFIYEPVKIKLSDLPDTIEHIHFGHNTADAIVFDKISFPKLTCVSTIDAHLDDHYLDGITNLLQAQKLQFENVSVCEVPRSVSEQIIGMQNLKQLFVFDFNSDFSNLYKEKNLEIMDAHPKLQYFNMFLYSALGPEQLCPTTSIKWLIEFGSTTRPLDRKFVIEVFNIMPFENTLEFAKEYTQGLHLKFYHDIELTRYQTKLSSLRDLRLTYHGSHNEDILRLSLTHHLNLAPNVQNFQIRFYTHGFSDASAQWSTIIWDVVCAFAQKNSSRTILLELSALGEVPHLNSYWPNVPKNLNVIMKSLKAE